MSVSWLPQEAPVPAPRASLEAVPAPVVEPIAAPPAPPEAPTRPAPPRPPALDNIRSLTTGNRLKVWWDEEASAWMCREGYVAPTPLPDFKDGDTQTHDGVWRVWPRMTGATKVRDKKFVDEKWRPHMVVEGLARDPALLMTPQFAATIRRLFTHHIAEVFQTPATDKGAWTELLRAATEEAAKQYEADLGGWNPVQKIVDEAFERGGGTYGSTCGKEIHHAAELLNKGMPLDEVVRYFPQWEKQTRGIDKALKVWGLEPVPELSEVFVVNTEIGYAGRADGIAKEGGEYVLIDYKSGKDLPPSAAEHANQYTGYLNAAGRFDFWANEGQGAFVRLPETLSRERAYTIGVPYEDDKLGVTKLTVDVRKAHEEVLPVTVAMAAMGKDSYAKDFLVGEPDFVPYEDPKLSWGERIDKATSKAEIGVIRKEAMAASEWTPALHALATEARAKL